MVRFRHEFQVNFDYFDRIIKGMFTLEFYSRCLQQSLGNGYRSGIRRYLSFNTASVGIPSRILLG